jgi:hypothetical protein
MSFAIPKGFELIGTIHDIETIARGHSVHQRHRLNRQYGKGNWRKRKGRALIRNPDGVIMWLEVHWFEAHGIGKKEVKFKRIPEQ